MTVIISSHNLRDLEDICDYIGILHQGEMLLQRDLDDLKSDVHKIQIAFRDDPPPDLQRSCCRCCIRKKRQRADSLIVRGPFKEIISRMESYHPAILDILPLTLEEIFIYEMGIEAMKSKTSFISMGILLNDFKRVFLDRCRLPPGPPAIVP